MAPIVVDTNARWGFYAFALAATALVGLLALKRSISRWGGIALLVLYAGFVAVVVLTGGAA